MDKKKLAIIAYSLFCKKRQKKKFWHKPWLGDLHRLKHSFTFNLEPIVFTMGNENSKIYVRLPIGLYNTLLEKVSPLITKRPNRGRLNITPREKLSLTLSFLAEGLSLQRLGFEYRVGVSTAFAIINDTISALISVLVEDYLTTPKNWAEWKAISNGFETQWNFPNCLGALDGKHIHVFPPRNSGSMFFNYKEGFSIILLALVDANYKFIAVDIGANGKCSDSGVWGECQLRNMMLSKIQNNIPVSDILPNSNIDSPYVILGDSGFPLEEFLMRPYPDQNMTPRERIFNYRLSRARRVSENAFGILSNRWRILLNRMLCSPEKASSIVTVCCALHNFICSHQEAKSLYMDNDLLDREDINTGHISPGLWREAALSNIRPRKTTKYNYDAKVVREKLKHYFSEQGKVIWQESSANIER